MNQKDVFLASEGNAWFLRNTRKLTELDDISDIVLEAIKFIDLPCSSHILEIGCSNGKRLKLLQNLYKNVDCFGIDPSKEAVNTGSKEYNLDLRVGTADSLPFDNNYFSLIIFGFSLYLCDRKDLFKIAYEADRCLCNKGYLIIKDFHPPFSYKNSYSHYEGLSSYKMDYSLMFKWNPSYTEIFKVISSHQGFIQLEIPDERIGVTILYKDESYAYPHDIQWM